MWRLGTSAGWRTITIAVTTVMALLFPVAASAATHVATGNGQAVARHVGAVRGKHKTREPHGAGSRNGDFTSYNWAGYVATNASGSNATSFNAVQAKWTVPAVTCWLSSTFTLITVPPTRDETGTI